MNNSVWETWQTTEDHYHLAVQAALDAVKEGVWDFNLITGKIHLSPVCLNMLGLEQGSQPAGPDSWFSFFHPEDRELATHAFQACNEGICESFEIDVRLNPPEKTRWIKLRAKVIQRGADGQPEHMIGAVSDITERHMMEEELRASEVQLRASANLLRESEEKYRALFQTSPDALIIFSADGQLLDWNYSARVLFGFSDDDFPHLRASDFFPNDIARALNSLPRHGLTLRAEIQRKIGQAFIAELHIQHLEIQGKTRVIANVRDITRHEQTQVDLKRQLQFNKALLTALPNPVFFKDTEGRYIGCNAAFSEQTGLSSDEIGGKSMRELWPGPLAEVHDKNDCDLIRSGGRQRYEAQLIRRDGTSRDVFYQKDVFRDETGRPIGLIGSYVDITERKRAERIQTALYRISESVQTVADLDELYREIHSVIGRLMQAKNFYIALYDEASGMLSYPYFVDEVDPQPAPEKLGLGLTSYVLRNGKALLASPEVFSELVDNGEVVGHGTDCLDWLGTPLKTLDKTIGVMAVQTYSPQVRYTAADQDMLGFVSTQVALAIERKRADEQIRTLNRTLQTISQVNQVLVRAINEEQLMQRVCQILVETGGYPLAWIGLAVQTGSGYVVSPKAMNGLDAGYMAHLAENQDGERLCCVETHQALNTGLAIAVNDISLSHPADDWGNMARACGFVSAMILPLISSGQVIGVAHVYSTTADAFQNDEIDLLTQMSDDLAFGISTLRSRIAHRIAEEELRRRETQLRDSEEKYRSVVERANDGIAIIQKFRVLFANNRLAQMWGGQPDEIVGMSFAEFVAPSALPAIKESFRKRIAGEPVSNTYRTLLRDRNGDEIEAELNSGPFNYQGQQADLVIVRDISERIRAEQDRAQRLAELEAVNRISSALRTVRGIDEMLNRLMDETLEVMNTSSGSIWLYDKSSGMLKVVVARGWYSGLSLQPKSTMDGIGGIVFTTGKPYITSDFKNDPNTSRITLDKNPEGWGGAVYPIYTTSERVGILYLGVPSQRVLKEEEKHFLSNLAEIAGNAIYRMRLQAQTDLHVQRLNALHNFDLAISSSLDLRLTLDDLLAQVISQLKVDAADVLLFNEHTQALEYASGRGLRGSSAKRARIRLGEGFAGKAALERSMVSVEDLAQVTLSLAQGLLWQGEDYHTYYGIPLIAEGKVEGVLEVFHRSAFAPDAEWLEFFETMAGRAAIAIMVSRLFESLHRSNIELRHAYDTTIEGLAKALEIRDLETKNHGSRVVEMTIELARELQAFNEEELVHIRRGALLHDIGKMGIPDRILLYEGPLNDEQWKIMREHPRYAMDILSPIPYLKRALDIPYSHHEKWDGTGYPQGLKGEQIPLAARIFSVVDVWDALSYKRPYRDAWPEEKVLEHLRRQSGRQFDPAVVEAFFRCYKHGRFRDFQESFAS